MILPNPDAPKRLSDMGIHRVALVVGTCGGHRMTRRLNDMGIHEGAPIEVLSGNGHGPVVVLVETSRLALGRGMAEKVLVREIA